MYLYIVVSLPSQSYFLENRLSLDIIERSNNIHSSVLGRKKEEEKVFFLEISGKYSKTCTANTYHAFLPNRIYSYYSYLILKGGQTGSIHIKISLTGELYIRFCSKTRMTPGAISLFTYTCVASAWSRSIPPGRRIPGQWWIT